MASTLINAVTCCTPCDDPQVVEVPGPQGEDGDAGAAGAAGQSAFTTLSANFTVPAELGSAAATVVNSSWMAVNMIVYAAKTDGSVRGHFQVTAIAGTTAITLKNLEDTATGAYPDNSAPGSVITSGSKVVSAGVQGPGGAIGTGVAGGDLKGNYPNPKLALPNSLGDIIVGNGTDAQALARGADGTILVSDAAAALDVTYKAIIPKTGDTNIAQNRLPRLSAATGLPIPLEASPAAIRNAGGAGTLVVDDRSSVSNARGTDATDLQSSRNAVTQVASGQESVIGGGRRNTNTGTRGVIAGGDTNSVSAQEAVVSGGSGNAASGARSVIGGGDTNVASGQECTVGGGNVNNNAGEQATIGGGDSNAVTAPGTESTIGGGHNNLIFGGTQSVIGGGEQNQVSSNFGTVSGGTGNQVTANAATIPGGSSAIADKIGQIAHATGAFLVLGDAQASSIVMRRASTDVTPVALYTDGASGQCTIPNNASWMFQIKLVARKDNGLTSIYKAEGLITNVAGVVTMPAAATVTEIYDGIGLPATPVAVTADDPNNALSIVCTGVAATNIHWVAEVQTVETIY